MMLQLIEQPAADTVSPAMLPDSQVCIPHQPSADSPHETSSSEVTEV